MAKTKFKFEFRRPLALVGGGLLTNAVTNAVEQYVPQASQYPYMAPGAAFLLGMYLDQRPPGKDQKTKNLLQNLGQGMLVSSGIELATIFVPGIENMIGDVINDPFRRTGRSTPGGGVSS